MVLRTSECIANGAGASVVNPSSRTPFALRLRPCFRCFAKNGFRNNRQPLKVFLCLLAIDSKFALADERITCQILHGALEMSLIGFQTSEGIQEKMRSIAAWALRDAQTYPTKCDTLRKKGFCIGECGYEENRRAFENLRREIWYETYRADLDRAHSFLERKSRDARLAEAFKFLLRKQCELDLPVGARLAVGQRAIAREIGLKHRHCSEQAAAKKAGRSMSALQRLGFIQVFGTGKAGVRSKRSDSYQVVTEPSRWASSSINSDIEHGRDAE